MSDNRVINNDMFKLDFNLAQKLSGVSQKLVSRHLSLSNLSKIIAETIDPTTTRTESDKKINMGTIKIDNLEKDDAIPKLDFNFLSKHKKEKFDYEKHVISKPSQNAEKTLCDLVKLRSNHYDVG